MLQMTDKNNKYEQMKEIKAFLMQEFNYGHVKFNIFDVMIAIAVLVVIYFILKFIYGAVSKRLPKDDKDKFTSIYSYFKWFVYVVAILGILNSIGVNLNALFAASAALLIGIGLALQTFFQDIISGVFILIDQSVHVGDIIELEGKVGRVEEIKLRTTRAVTIDNKVLVIPNHLYLTNSLYNWTQNGAITRENVVVGVAYGSDVQLVKKLLLEAANSHESILEYPEPLVLFTNFGDSALEFRLVFTLNDSFMGSIPKSDLRFEIDRLFREHDISIPFPQRDVHIVSKIEKTL